MHEIKVSDKIVIRQLAPYVWEVVRAGDMRVPGRIYTDRRGIGESGPRSRMARSGMRSSRW